MATVGERLRQAREVQNLTITQVAEVTKIRTDHIRALEESNFNVFSAPVYIRGFVRCYATMLKLDVAHTMTELDGELGQTKKFSEPPPLTDSPKGLLDFVMLQLSRIDWLKGGIALGALAGFAVILIIYFVWKHNKNTDPLSGLKPGIYQSTQTVSGQTLPLPKKK